MGFKIRNKIMKSLNEIRKLLFFSFGIETHTYSRNPLFEPKVLDFANAHPIIHRLEFRSHSI